MHYDLITIEEFKEAMPSSVRKSISPDLVAQINTVIAEPEVAAIFRENVIGLSNVMSGGKFKIDSYLHAVKFVSHKLLKETHIQAWAKTFPSRYNAAMQRGDRRSEVAAVASRYAGSKLVTLLMGQTMMPTHILNAPLFQEALNTQADLMRSAKSEKVRCDAAYNLMQTLKPPEAAKIELDIAVKEDDSIRALRETTMGLVRLQQEMIRTGGASVKSIAQSDLSVTEGEIVQ
jgi:hypothetical protein